MMMSILLMSVLVVNLRFSNSFINNVRLKATSPHCSTFLFPPPQSYTSLLNHQHPRKNNAVKLFKQTNMFKGQTRKQEQLFLSSSSLSVTPEPEDEMTILGELYEMIELPDSMIDTTIFVGNLCEFVTDEMLSDLFQESSSLRYVPAFVARKANGYSLKYGFVTFPSILEKEAAISKFHGYTLNDRIIKVEPIQDASWSKTNQRVRVPGKLVTFVVGSAKKTLDGKVNTLRRISRDDVERLSRGQKSKKKGYGSRNIPHRLNEEEQGAFLRARKYGFVTLDGTGYRRGRKGSPLSNIHRQWCDSKAKPQIILCKASAGRQFDNVIVDLSPLRIGALNHDKNIVDQSLMQYHNEIMLAAQNSGIDINPCIEEDNTITSNMNNEEYDDAVFLEIDSPEMWAVEPIWKLPVISIGVFEGERHKAKIMVKELAQLWDVCDKHINTSDEPAMNKSSRRSTGSKRGGRTKMKTLSRYKR